MFECNICFETAFEPVVTRCGHLSEARIRWKNGSSCDFWKDFVAESGVYSDRQGHKGHVALMVDDVGVTQCCNPCDRVAGSVGNVCICGFPHLEGLKKFVVNGFVGPLGTSEVGDAWGLLGPRSAYGNLQPSNGWSSCPVCKVGNPFVKSAEDS